MYVRDNGRFDIEWSPKNENLGEKAMTLTEGTGVSETPISDNIRVSNDVSNEILDTYSYLITVAEYDGENTALDYTNREELEKRSKELTEKHNNETPQ